MKFVEILRWCLLWIVIGATHTSHQRTSVTSAHQSPAHIRELDNTIRSVAHHLETGNTLKVWASLGFSILFHIYLWLLSALFDKALYFSSLPVGGTGVPEWKVSDPISQHTNSCWWTLSQMIKDFIFQRESIKLVKLDFVNWFQSFQINPLIWAPRGDLIGKKNFVQDAFNRVHVPPLSILCNLFEQFCLYL